MPRPGIEYGPLDCKSEELPIELRGPLGIIQFEDVYKIYHVSNCVIMMMKVISHLFKLVFTKKASIITWAMSAKWNKQLDYKESSKRILICGRFGSQNQDIFKKTQQHLT